MHYLNSTSLGRRRDYHQRHAIVLDCSQPLTTHAMSNQNQIRIDYEGNFAIITLNNPNKFNSLTQSLFSRLASLLREVDANKDVYVTLLIGEGPFFSA